MAALLAGALMLVMVLPGVAGASGGTANLYFCNGSLATEGLLMSSAIYNATNLGRIVGVVVNGEEVARITAFCP